jgi:hypothetical protein
MKKNSVHYQIDELTFTKTETKLILSILSPFVMQYKQDAMSRTLFLFLSVKDTDFLLTVSSGIIQWGKNSLLPTGCAANAVFQPSQTNRSWN